MVLSYCYLFTIILQGCQGDKKINTCSFCKYKLKYSNSAIFTKSQNKVREQINMKSLNPGHLVSEIAPEKLFHFSVPQFICKI